MKLFVSFSGPASKKLAKAFADWIVLVVQPVRPWISEEISKGDRWTVELLSALEGAKFGIIIVTPENWENPWINFEAGALSNQLDRKVSPLLFNLSVSQLRGSPLSQLQVTAFHKEDVRKLVSDISSQLEEPLRDDVVNSVFEKNWMDLKRTCDAILLEHAEDNSTSQVESLDAEGTMRSLADDVAKMRRDLKQLEVQQREFTSSEFRRFREHQIASLDRALRGTQALISRSSDLENEISSLLSMEFDKDKTVLLLRIKNEVSEIRRSVLPIFDNVYTVRADASEPGDIF